MAIAKKSSTTKEKYLKHIEKQKKLANSALDSAYSKLLSPNVTKETMLRHLLNTGHDAINFIVGHLSIKITEDFLNGKEINSKQYYKALKILESIKYSPSIEIFDEYTESKRSSNACSIGYPIRDCIVNMAVRKLKQECPNLSKLFKILDKLDLRDD